VIVHDDGPGISPELLPRVTERFVRGDGARSPATSSTGLGLPIVAGVVAAHGGTVLIASSPGDTRVTVTLPTLPELV
jgi:two-component system, OmpR family, sensor kinase